MAVDKNNTTKNAIKNSPKEDAKEPKKKSGSKKMKFSLGFLKNEVFHRIIGLFLIVFSIFLFISFVSHFIYWKADNNYSNLSLGEILTNVNLDISNWGGNIGATLAYMFLNKWFGFASFLFVLLFFVFGVKLVTKVSILHLGKTFRFSFFGLIWLSAAFGYIFKNNDLLTGFFGFQVNIWLQSVLGKVGTGLLLFFTLVSFGFIVFNSFFSYIIERFAVSRQESKERASEEKSDYQFNSVRSQFKPGSNDFEMHHADESDEEDEFDNLTDEEINPVLKTSFENDPFFDDEVKAIELNTPEVQAKQKAPVNDDDIEMTVEEVTEEKVVETTEHYTVDTEYDPTLDLRDFKFPDLDLLEDYGTNQISVNREELEANKDRIINTLNNYSIQIDKIKATIGPTVTLYEIVPAPGVRISRIKNLEDDIALSLSALGIRIIAPMPGKGTIGIEVPNQKPEVVSLKTILSSERFQNSGFELPIGLGKTISNESYVADLTKMPHLLMAGATGQGKSVGLNAIIASLVYKKHPATLKFVMVDPKKVELTLFSKIERHYLAKLPDSEDAIITDTRKVVRTLTSLCIEMDNRYDLLKNAQVRNIKEYNSKFIERKLNPNEGHRFLPYIVLVVDEFADLIMTAGKEIETPIARLAQLARAIGIHLIIATQRPSVNIITGAIKANFPCRVAFRVTSKIDSRTILDTGGADQLIGRGDMLLLLGSTMIRLQCAFIDTPEIDRITDFIGSQRAYLDAYHLPEVEDEESEGVGDFDPSQRDPMFEDAARVIVQSQHGSTSLIQRKLKLGYNRAGRIIDQLEASGIVGPFEGSKAREVLIKDEMALEQFLRDRL